MKKSLPVVAMLAVVALATSSLSDEPDKEATAKFAIENMSCATCPISVRKAMERVNGVKVVVVDFDSKTAIVTFDSSIVTAIDVGNASTDVGFPATVLDAQ